MKGFLQTAPNQALGKRRKTADSRIRDAQNLFKILKINAKK